MDLALPISNPIRTQTNPQTTTMNTSYTRSSSHGTPNDESERLSSDLALFLSNPALSSGLADGSLDLASYSSTINSELAILERECIALHRDAAPDILVLREEMGVCDSILAGLQEMLLVRFVVVSAMHNFVFIERIFLR
jgi:hypothetical protein